MVYSSSLACADLLNLENDARELIRAGHPMFHIDLMDGHYVPNLCLSLDIVKALKKKFSCTIDAHLMADAPFDYVEACADAGVDYLSFHLDSTCYPYRLLKKIKDCGMKAGIVLNPKNKPEELGALAKEMDLCLVMSIEPGFSGQKFMDLTYEKIKYLSELREKENLQFQISVDGGVNVENGKKCRELGVDILVMGVFSFFNQGMPIYDACNVYTEKVER